MPRKFNKKVKIPLKIKRHFIITRRVLCADRITCKAVVIDNDYFKRRDMSNVFDTLLK